MIRPLLRHNLAALTLAAGLALAAAADAQSITAASTYQIRGSDLIGKTVSNRLDQKIGTIDDLLITDGKITHVVLSVGGFLGIGDKLVALPYGELKTQGNAVLIDKNVEQLKTTPDFKYRQVASNTGGGRDEFMRETNQSMDEWGNKVDSWKQTAKDKSSAASQKLDQAWQNARDRFSDLKNATADGWERAKANFDKAWNDLQRAWHDASA